jgi:hypothetical protein
VIFNVVAATGFDPSLEQTGCAAIRLLAGPGQIQNAQAFRKDSPEELGILGSCRVDAFQAALCHFFVDGLLILKR